MTTRETGEKPADLRKLIWVDTIYLVVSEEGWTESDDRRVLESQFAKMAGGHDAEFG